MIKSNSIKCTTVIGVTPDDAISETEAGYVSPWSY